MGARQLSQVRAARGDHQAAAARQLQRGRRIEQMLAAFLQYTLRVARMQLDALVRRQREIQARGHRLPAQRGIAFGALQLQQAIEFGLADGRRRGGLGTQPGQVLVGALGALQIIGMARRVGLGALQLLLQAEPVSLQSHPPMRLARRGRTLLRGLGLFASGRCGGFGRLLRLPGAIERLRARQGLGLLPFEALQFLQQQPLRIIQAVQLLLVGLQQLLALVQRLQALFGLGQLLAELLPGLRRFVILMLAAQGRKLIDLLPIGVDLRIERRQFRLQCLDPRRHLGIIAARLAGASQQLTSLRTQLFEQLVAAAGGQRAGRGIDLAAQRIVQVLARMAHVELLRRALLDPQQPRNTPVLRLARALGGKCETEQLRQMVLGVAAVQRARADLQQTALLAEKALDQPMRLAVEFEVELDLRRGPAALTPWAQIVDGSRPIALEERGANRPHQRALARLVRAGDDVQAGFEISQFQRAAKTPQLLDAQPLDAKTHGCGACAG